MQLLARKMDQKTTKERPLFKPAVENSGDKTEDIYVILMLCYIQLWLRNPIRLPIFRPIQRVVATPFIKWVDFVCLEFFFFWPHEWLFLFLDVKSLLPIHLVFASTIFLCDHVTTPPSPFFSANRPPYPSFKPIPNWCYQPFLLFIVHFQPVFHCLSRSLYCPVSGA